MWRIKMAALINNKGGTGYTEDMSDTVGIALPYYETVYVNVDYEPCCPTLVREFIMRSGKIYMAWNPWWSRYVFWVYVTRHKAIRRLEHIFRFRRRSINRGRGFDRKYHK